MAVITEYEARRAAFTRVSGLRYAASQRTQIQTFILLPYKARQSTIHPRCTFPKYEALRVAETDRMHMLPYKAGQQAFLLPAFLRHKATQRAERHTAGRVFSSMITCPLLAAATRFFGN